uniref:Reverse transcriptase zinc-binding domain-containing protein n=1 Tax=Salix viminalis TaxID=40686 RepID=A0A6N2MII3_SALVM
MALMCSAIIIIKNTKTERLLLFITVHCDSLSLTNNSRCSEGCWKLSGCAAVHLLIRCFFLELEKKLGWWLDASGAHSGADVAGQELLQEDEEELPLSTLVAGVAVTGAGEDDNRVYWSSMFILPVAVTRSIESIMARLLWKGSSLEKYGVKVSWEHLCYPLKEGGLGVKRLQDWNKAALLKLIWRIYTKKDSGWSGWVHSVLLKGRNFWEVKVPAKASWSWRKIMDSRNWCKGFFRSIIGDGQDTSLWFDHWLPEGKSLFDSFPARILSATGLGWNAKNTKDKYIWPAQASGIFSIASAWNLIRRSRGDYNLHG